MRSAVFNATHDTTWNQKVPIKENLPTEQSPLYAYQKAVKDDADFADIHRAFPDNFRRTADSWP